MRNNRSLDPDQRILYGASLKPPVDYVFDTAVTTTYSLDLATALAVPVSLALFAAENRDDILKSPLALLQGAERMAERLLIFTDAGRIHAQVSPHSRLCSLFENIVVEVAAPKGGAFHPKMWVLRYKPQGHKGPKKLRLLILSRNLTRDRSWDIAATFDGEVTNKRKATNSPLVKFLQHLPRLESSGVSEKNKEIQAQVDDLAKDLHRVEWINLPDPFESVSFAVNGLGGKLWRHESCNHLGVISPFCDDDTLSMLARLAPGGKSYFIGRTEELSKVRTSTLDRFDGVAVLDENAVMEDGEEFEPTSQGLHAKIFVAERSWDTEITVGSGNATRPALLTGKNVEIFATLTGRRSRVGSVEEIFSKQGFGRLTQPFNPNELNVDKSAQREAENRLDDARNEICRNTPLELRCERVERDENSIPLWRLWLVPLSELSLAGVREVRVWPITRGEAQSKDVLESLRKKQSTDLGEMELADLTRFLAFRVSDEEEECDPILFSTGVAMEGLPSGRDAAILCSIVNNKDAFLRLLRLLLSDYGDQFAAVMAAQDASGHSTWRTMGDDKPLLEEMVRALCKGGDQLREIDRLIMRLENAEGVANPIPPDFRSLWNTFREANKAQFTKHGG